MNFAKTSFTLGSCVDPPRAKTCLALERATKRVTMPEVFGFRCPSCGESLGAELPAKTMAITCTACGLDFAVKRPAKGKDEAAAAAQVNHWKQQRSRSVHKDANGVVDAAAVKERLQARQATIAALSQPPHYTRAAGEPGTPDASKKGKGKATRQQGKGKSASAAAATAAAAAAAAGTGVGAASSSQEVSPVRQIALRPCALHAHAQRCPPSAGECELLLWQGQWQGNGTVGACRCASGRRELRMGALVNCDHGGAHPHSRAPLLPLSSAETRASNFVGRFFGKCSFWHACMLCHIKP